MWYIKLVPSRTVPASPVGYRRRRPGVVWALLLLVAGVVPLVVGLAVGHYQHRVERTIEADQVVTAEIYRAERATYRGPDSQVHFARVPEGLANGTFVDFLVDPVRPDRLQDLGATPPAAWIAPTLSVGGAILLLSGIGLAVWLACRRPPADLTRAPLFPRWESNVAVILGDTKGSATGPAVRPWLPPEPEADPPSGRTRVLRFAWTSPAATAFLSALFSFGLPQVGGAGREWVVVVAAVALWAPAVVLTLAAAAYRVEVRPDGQLTIRTVVNRRRYDLTQLTQVTGWTWSIDKSDVVDGKPRLGCWNLGLHFRDGRHLFYSPTNVRDHQLVGRAVRWWALRTGAAVTPDMAYALGLIADPRVVNASPLPIAYDDPVMRRPRRRVRSAMMYVSHVGVVFLIIGVLPAANAVFGPPPDPRVFADPCALLDPVDVAGPFAPAHDTAAWQGCAAGESRDVWLSVNPSLHAALRTVRYWLDGEDELAVAPIRDESWLSAMAVDYAHLVVYGDGHRITIAYVATEVSGIASVTGNATDSAGQPLTDPERFETALDLVRAVTGSPQGNQPVRSLQGDGTGDRIRDQVVAAGNGIAYQPDQVAAWLTTVGRSPDLVVH